MRLARNVVILLVSGMLLATGTAGAEPAPQPADQPSQPPSAAVVVQWLHDQLQAESQAGDVVALRRTVAVTDTVLDALNSPDAGLARTETGAIVVEADGLNGELAAALAAVPERPQPAPDAAQRGLLGPLDAVIGLVTSLLSTLLNLVSSLLGNLPLPLPLPIPLPGLPVPGPPVPPVMMYQIS